MAAAMMAAILRRQSCDSVLRCGLYAATLSMRSYQAVPDTISPQCLSEDFIHQNTPTPFDSKILMSWFPLISFPIICTFTVYHTVLTISVAAGIRPKFITPVSPWQVRNKSVPSWRGKTFVASVMSCRFPNSVTTTCCGLVGRVANKSVTRRQLPRLYTRKSYYAYSAVHTVAHL